MENHGFPKFYASLIFFKNINRIGRFVNTTAGFLYNFEYEFPDFFRLFLDLDSPDDLPKLDTIKIIYLSVIKYYGSVCKKIKSGT